MATYTYTGTLTDVGVQSLAGYEPRLTVRPEVEAMGPDGLVSDQRRVVELTGTAFSMTLIPSSQLTGARGGGGVKYVLELSLFAETQDGSDWLVWSNEWRFTAIEGGGPIAEMGDVPALALYVGPPWPAKQLPGVYIDQITGDVGYYAIGVN